jgi:DNA-binding NarL/FixJ family response regulator
MSNAEIADRSCSPSAPVEVQLYRAMIKLGVNDRRQL